MARLRIDPLSPSPSRVTRKKSRSMKMSCSEWKVRSQQSPLNFFIFIGERHKARVHEK